MMHIFNTYTAVIVVVVVVVTGVDAVFVDPVELLLLLISHKLIAMVE